MICPHCGYNMGTRSKCLRCGYEEKTLAVIDEKKADEEPRADGKKADEEKPDVKVIDPCNVYLTHPYGYDDDYGTGFGPFSDPFSSLFGDLFGDPIGDLLGGLFGFDLGGGRRAQSRQSRQQDDQPKKRRKQGPVVEMDKNDFEILDENDNPVKPEKSSAHSAHSSDSGKHTHKNSFKHRRK